MDSVGAARIPWRPNYKTRAQDCMHAREGRRHRRRRSLATVRLDSDLGVTRAGCYDRDLKPEDFVREASLDLIMASVNNRLSRVDEATRYVCCTAGVRRREHAHVCARTCTRRDFQQKFSLCL